MNATGVIKVALLCVQSLLKALGMFAGAVVAFRNFGDAVFL